MSTFLGITHCNNECLCNLQSLDPSVLIYMFCFPSSFSASFTETVVESGGIFYSYCNKVFASWDYCIFNDKAASLKKKNIYQDLQVKQ